MDPKEAPVLPVSGSDFSSSKQGQVADLVTQAMTVRILKYDTLVD